MLGSRKKLDLVPRIARVIRELRTGKGMTQKELAFRSGTSESALRSYELGDRKPKAEVVDHIAMELRVRPEYLSAPEFANRMEFVYALLENDDRFGYTITEINGHPAIVANDTTAGHGFSGLLNEWNEMKQKLDAKEITPEEYEEWKRTCESGWCVTTPDGKSPYTTNKLD